MMTLFFITFALLIAAEIVKGLSANGTPPVLQKFSWQMDLAWVMWRSIGVIRLLLFVLLSFLLVRSASGFSTGHWVLAALLFVVWAFFLWLFNFFWVGKYKFDPLVNPTFVGAADNAVDLSGQIMGVDLNGEQKAYPVEMAFYHHQIPDRVGDHPIWITYCGLCRSGRVYDLKAGDSQHTFTLVGAITFNAVFEDQHTGSWWRQETGEAVKGKLKGSQLQDIELEHMSLAHWLEKHPNSKVLQYDPQYADIYRRITFLLNGDGQLPAWHLQEESPLIIGLELEGQAKAYDWDTLRRDRLIEDEVAGTALLLLSSADGLSPFAYQRSLNGRTLNFEIAGDELSDQQTGSRWNLFGKCVGGELLGEKLPTVQIHQQNRRSWESFHTNSSYY